MNRVIAAAEILEHELSDARQQCDAEPGNVLLAMRLSRLQVITSLVKTFGVGSDIASGHVPIAFEPLAGVDDRSGAGDELAGSGCSITIANACASERGHPEADDVSGRCQQLSLPLDT